MIIVVSGDSTKTVKTEIEISEIEISEALKYVTRMCRELIGSVYTVICKDETEMQLHTTTTTTTIDVREDMC